LPRRNGKIIYFKRMRKPKYKRILLKLSGESFRDDESVVSFQSALSIAKRVKEVHALGVEIAIVIGGGNIIRGLKDVAKGFDRTQADYMGMLSTVVNGLALQNALEAVKVHTRLMTAIEMRQLAEPYIRRRAIRHLEKNRIVILAGGTGNPFFSTDTAAALRAIEINAALILKATDVDGVYSADPKLIKTAKKYRTLSYIEVLNKGLGIMDSTAISLCMDNNLPIMVFNVMKEGNIKKAVVGELVGTMVC